MNLTLEKMNYLVSREDAIQESKKLVDEHYNLPITK